MNKVKWLKNKSLIEIFSNQQKDLSKKNTVIDASTVYFWNFVLIFDFSKYIIISENQINAS